ncbi:peptidyl-prolyl cis-trans isomerase 6-like [Diadema setosum]|uniref:peptidyl-prolyl cis-trans isomerase 6-like n=1 Tax=Diadema setosum TaxID=31175 RepID=UPI003B3AD93C
MDLYITLLLFVALVAAFVKADDPEAKALVTHKVSFDISIGGEPVGTIELGLFGEVVPKTVANFLTFSDPKNEENYVNTKFHRVIRDFMVQGGDFMSSDGSGSRSIFGKDHFDDENFKLDHYGAGWLAMANAGPNTNGCQFYITTVKTKWLDGAHVVFGKILSGIDTLAAVERTETDANDKPVKDVVVTASSVEELAPFDRFEVEKLGVTMPIVDAQ